VYALDLLLDRIPDPLVDESARKNLRMIGDQLPDGLTTRIGLEARLGTDHEVDLLLLAATHEQLTIVAGNDPKMPMPDGFAGLAGWDGIVRLAERSLHLGRYREPLAPPIWLKFDAGRERSDLPAPDVFTAAAPDPGDRRATNWDVSGTVAEVLATVSGQAPPRGLIAEIDWVAACGLTVRQIGSSALRPGTVVRLLCAFETAGDEPERLLAALGRCGWSGPAEAVADWTARCAEWADVLHVGLDVTAEGIRPGIAIEVSQVGTLQPYEDPRWGGFLDLLRNNGLCTPAKRDAVCRLGEEYETELYGRHRYRQGLHHVELAVAGNGKASAKVYFGGYELPTRH
jgi:hypothetical protein